VVEVPVVGVDVVQVLDAINHLHDSNAGPSECAAVIERRAALLERIAVEDRRPEAAEQTAEARARAAQYRAEAEGTTK
jgi:hypothetical protein